MSTAENTFIFSTDSPDRAEHYLKALDYYLALSDFRQLLRSKLKHGDYTLEQQQVVEEIWQDLHEVLNTNSISNV